MSAALEAMHTVALQDLLDHTRVCRLCRNASDAAEPSINPSCEFGWKLLLAVGQIRLQMVKFPETEAHVSSR